MGKFSLKELLSSKEYISPRFYSNIKDNIFARTTRKKVSFLRKIKYLAPVGATFLFAFFLLNTLGFFDGSFGVKKVIVGIKSNNIFVGDYVNSGNIETGNVVVSGKNEDFDDDKENFGRQKNINHFVLNNKDYGDKKNIHKENNFIEHKNFDKLIGKKEIGENIKDNTNNQKNSNIVIMNIRKDISNNVGLDYNKKLESGEQENFNVDNKAELESKKISKTLFFENDKEFDNVKTNNEIKDENLNEKLSKNNYKIKYIKLSEIKGTNYLLNLGLINFDKNIKNGNFILNCYDKNGKSLIDKFSFSLDFVSEKSYFIGYKKLSFIAGEVSWFNIDNIDEIDENIYCDIIDQNTVDISDKIKLKVDSK